MSFKEKVLNLIKQADLQSFTSKQLKGLMLVHSTAERRAVDDALDQLCNDLLLVFDSKTKRFRLAREGEFATAVFEGNQRGFGFLLVEGGDLFVPASKTNGAYHKDTVVYRRILGTEDEAEIVKIVSRGMTEIVGTYDKSNNARFVLPDEKRFISDIYIPVKKDFNAKHGQKVIVRIKVYPADNRNNPEGEIVQILGYPDEKNVDMLSVAYSFGHSLTFPEEVQKRAEKLPQVVGEKDIENRTDLRKRRIFTIDGEDAKDLDDAVSISKNHDGTFTLGVHIADVSHYVKTGDDIDKEAFRRGTSVYLPEMVFPMLPKLLSNGICSLYEGVDRLTLSCEMKVDGKGNVVEYDVFPSVINSCHRMTYTAVQAIFDGDKDVQSQYADILDDLMAMKQLAEILQAKRNKRGNIDFSSKEVIFVHDDEGNVCDILPFETKFANQLIEEFMILANETVAEYAQNCNYPFVYRVHEKPDEEKLAVLLALLKSIGIQVKHSQVVHNTILQDALNKAKDTQYYNLVSDVMLRTMQKAKYSETNSGHFGLASQCYCHFTSPIRRYPDLIVHRILKTAVLGKMTEKALAAYEDIASQSAMQSNIREKVAVETERKAVDVKKCAYAETLVGQTFSAIISGVTENGFFAELPNTVEGFVSIDKLHGYFTYNKLQFCLQNGATKYSLGDIVNVTVQSVNRQACKIDFDLAKNID